MSGEFTPVRIKRTNKKDEHIPLFYIDDVEYTIPKRPRPNIGLRYMRTLKETGSQETAIAQLLEDMLGTDGYNALVDYDELTSEQFEDIMSVVQKVALGDAEKATKN